MNRQNAFSLTAMVIIMALMAIFVGYLLGNWIIQLVTGEIPQEQVFQENEIIEEDTLEDEKDSEASSGQSDNVINSTKNDSGSSEENNTDKQIAAENVYAVQVGAFNSQANAEKLKQKLTAEGFQVTVTDNRPYKVLIGATDSRSEAKNTEKELEKLGYKDSFITH